MTIAILLRGMITMEIWKDVPSYEGLYQVSTLGRVKSLCRHNISERYHSQGYYVKEKILKVRKRGKQQKYYSVALFKNGIRTEYSVHRLVMLAFVGKSNLTVNHIDKDTSNNALSNLEYLPNADNLRYSKCKKVNQYTLNNEFIKTWDSIIDTQTNLHIGHISQVCNGIRKSAGGFGWKFKGDDES